MIYFFHYFNKLDGEAIEIRGHLISSKISILGVLPFKGHMNTGFQLFQLS